VSDADRGLVRRIDELYPEHPFAGPRMHVRILRHESLFVGRKHVRKLMKRIHIDPGAHPALVTVLRAPALVGLTTKVAHTELGNRTSRAADLACRNSATNRRRKQQLLQRSFSG
jgi:hypothetical protein